MRALLQIGIVMAAWTISTSTGLGAWLSPCKTARLVASWKHDGLWLSSAIDAFPISAGGNRVRLVGRLRAGGRSYDIYYDDHSEPDSEAHDATKNLVVTSGRGKFLGLYNISDIADIYGEPTGTDGSDVLFPAGKANGAPFGHRLHFGPKGPPKTIPRFYGYDLGFMTPAEIRKDLPRTKPWPEPGPRVATYCRR